MHSHRRQPHTYVAGWRAEELHDAHHGPARKMLAREKPQGIGCVEHTTVQGPIRKPSG